MERTFGPWIDEFYSLWASEPSVPLGEALRARWAYDVHPPLYVALLRAWRTLFPDAGLAALRMTDLAGPAGLVLYGVAAWARRPDRRAFVAAALVLAAGNALVLAQLRDLRPYATLICAGDILALAAALAWGHLEAGLRASRLDLAAGAAAFTVLVNGHYVSALDAGLMGAAYVLALLRAGRRGAAATLTGFALLASLPTAVFLAWRSTYMLGWTGGGFWIRTSTPEALRIVGAFVLHTANPLLLGAAAVALALSRGRAWTPVWTGVGTVAAGLAVLLTVNLHTPIVEERYLGFLCGPLAVALAALVSAPPRPWLYALALLASAASTAAGAWTHGRGHEDGWNGTARRVAAQVAACPGARVDTFHWSDPYFRPLPTDRAVRDYAYARLARLWGFAPALGRPLAQTDPRCPRILWGEHLGPALGLPDAPSILRKLMTGRNPIDPVFIRPDLMVERGETGYVLVTPPPPR